MLPAVCVPPSCRNVKRGPLGRKAGDPGTLLRLAPDALSETWKGVYHRPSGVDSPFRWHLKPIPNCSRQFQLSTGAAHVVLLQVVCGRFGAPPGSDMETPEPCGGTPNSVQPWSGTFHFFHLDSKTKKMKQLARELTSWGSFGAGCAQLELAGHLPPPKSTKSLRKTKKMKQLARELT